jgi:general secretion pathway protein B
LSFILDALQKSENQRQQQLGPGRAAVRQGKTSQPVPVWVPVVAVLLIVNILVLAFVMWPDAVEEQVSATGEQRDPNSIATQDSDGAMAAEERGEVRPLSREAAATTPKDDGPDAASIAEENQAGTGSVTIMTKKEMDEFLGPKTQSANNTASSTGSVIELVTNEQTAEVLLPTLEALQLRGLVSLTELHLDVHVYSDVAIDRFVFVNMKKYREGDRLREGPLLESITTQGIVLQYSGQRFVLNQE